MADEETPSRQEPVESPEQFVVEQMQAGADEETIVARLEERGLERSQARHVVDTVYPQVARAAEAERYTPSALAPAIAAALAAAIVGGIAWGLIVVTTDYEIGFAALGIGLLAGYAVVVATRGRKGLPLQVVAVFASLLGILLGKYFTYYYLFKEAVRDQIGDEAADQISLFDSELIGFFFDDFDMVFGGWDLLWAGLAVYAAWRIPRGLGVDVRRSPVSGG
jgi:hypothetical protein